jgi:hypothetical protein
MGTGAVCSTEAPTPFVPKSRARRGSKRSRDDTIIPFNERPKRTIIPVVKPFLVDSRPPKPPANKKKLRVASSSLKAVSRSIVTSFSIY